MEHLVVSWSMSHVPWTYMFYPCVHFLAVVLLADQSSYRWERVSHGCTLKHRFVMWHMFWKISNGAQEKHKELFWHPPAAFEKTFGPEGPRLTGNNSPTHKMLWQKHSWCLSKLNLKKKGVMFWRMPWRMPHGWYWYNPSKKQLISKFFSWNNKKRKIMCTCSDVLS